MDERVVREDVGAQQPAGDEQRGDRAGGERCEAFEQVSSSRQAVDRGGMLSRRPAGRV
jgi:hypothetical protein